MKITNDSFCLESPIDGEKRTLYDFIQNEDSESPDSLIVDKELKQSIRNSLSLLSEKEEEESSNIGHILLGVLGVLILLGVLATIGLAAGFGASISNDLDRTSKKTSRQASPT